MTDLNTTNIINDLDVLYPEMKARAVMVLQKCQQAGINVAPFETLRTQLREQMLYAQKRSETLNSYHCLGLAVDFVFRTPEGGWTWDKPNEDWDQLADIIESCGLISGWRWATLKDGPHGELKIPGMPAMQLYAKLDELGLNGFYSFLTDNYFPQYKNQPQPGVTSIPVSQGFWITIINNILGALGFSK